MNTMNIKSNEQIHTILNRRKVLKYGLCGISGLLANSIPISGCSKKNKPKPPIILITVDTLRADHLGCYGYSRNTSPVIDQFAKESMLFENCFSHAPKTTLSFPSILSGYLPHETGIVNNNSLPDKNLMIAEILQKEGYKTAAVIGNYILRKKRGWSQGFDIYDDNMGSKEVNRPQPEKTAKEVTNSAIELLGKFHEEQLFMWVHYQDPHGPYTAPEHFKKIFLDHNKKPKNLKTNDSVSGKGGIPDYQVLDSNRDFNYYVSQYDSEIRYQNEQLKLFIDALKNYGLYDDALIIFTSDHGENMGEHNYYFSHGENLYNSLIHVPLILKYGDKLSGRRQEYVQHIDIVPTILNILGLEASHFRGLDLREQHKTEREIFALMKRRHATSMQFSIIKDEFKLIYAPSTEEYKMFNLKIDTQETTNLVTNTEYSKKAEELKAALHRIKKEDTLKLGSIKKSPKYTEQEKTILKSLGYVE